MTASRVSATPDDLVRRYVELVRADLEPDPLFRRRLRGVVTNGFVAAREGLAEPVGRPSAMGRVGRACLYATFAFAVSVGGVMAASRAALPGDLLYPVKLEIEALRARALPAEFQDDLAVLALSERIHEMGRLAESGDWAAVAALAPAIEAGYEHLEALGISPAAGGDVLLSRLEVLETLRTQLPAAAQAAIDRVFAHDLATGRNGLQGAARGYVVDGPAAPPTGTGQRASVPTADDDADDEPSDQAVQTPRPTPTAKPSATATDAHRPSPSPAGADDEPGSDAGDDAQPEDDSQD